MATCKGCCLSDSAGCYITTALRKTTITQSQPHCGETERMGHATVPTSIEHIRWGLMRDNHDKNLLVVHSRIKKDLLEEKGENPGKHLFKSVPAERSSNNSSNGSSTTRSQSNMQEIFQTLSFADCKNLFSKTYYPRDLMCTAYRPRKSAFWSAIHDYRTTR
uniref:Uncharacterized protein n=1 Tax=Glossina pallidipes TaxID=7398 RepID=A0A1A9ZTB3_GLOPL